MRDYSKDDWWDRDQWGWEKAEKDSWQELLKRVRQVEKSVPPMPIVKVQPLPAPKPVAQPVEEKLGVHLTPEGRALVLVATPEGLRLSEV